MREQLSQPRLWVGIWTVKEASRADAIERQCVVLPLLWTNGTSGRNSKAIVVSIGMLPPIPKPLQKANPWAPSKLGAPAIAIPNTPAMPTVRLKAQYRPWCGQYRFPDKYKGNIPMTSTRIPKVNAPTHKPADHTAKRSADWSSGNISKVLEGSLTSTY